MNLVYNPFKSVGINHYASYWMKVAVVAWFQSRGCLWLGTMWLCWLDMPSVASNLAVFLSERVQH